MLSLEKVGAIGRTYREVQRYKGVLQVLFKYGFGYLVDRLNIEQYLEIGYRTIARKPWEKLEELTLPERVRHSLEELGPTFVKLGQILSTRPDLIPVDFIRELEKLQDSVPSFPYEDACRIIEEELGLPVDDLFSSFSSEPFAAASIGQVHRAVLKNGEEVVVKVQRPGIRKTIQVDLEIMAHLAELAERSLKSAELQRPTAIVKEFARTLNKEINYRTEAYHMERFRSQFTGDETLHVPKVYAELSSERVLTMEFVRGIKSSEVERLRAEGYDLDQIAHRGALSLMRQIFVFGFFHGDPHPGNILILPENVICFLDFGMMGSVSLRDRQNFADFITQIIGRDEHKVTDAVMKLTYHDQDPPRDELERDVAEIIEEHLYRPLKDLETGRLLEQVLNALTKYGLRLKPNLFLMLKSLITIDRLGNMLNPGLELVREAEPFIRTIQMKRLSPVNFLRNMISPTLEFFELIREIPSDFHVLIRQLKEGRLKLEFEHVGLDPLRDSVERVSNRVSFAIVLAALIVGNALITFTRAHEILGETVRYMGMIGFAVAGIVGFWMLLVLIHSRKL